MQEINFIFGIAILVMSVVIHEVSHGYTAYVLGDPTAKESGRLTLNPFKHLDLYGSLIVPVLTFLTGGFILGWAKPVPYNPYNLKDQRKGSALVGAAGPLSNFLVAVIFGLAIRYGSLFTFLPISFFQIAALIVVINLNLGIFNSIPIPPLDGSKILFNFLPSRWQNFELLLERFGFLILIVFLLVFYRLLLPLTVILFKLITGLSF
jgi:Zn-dependent protease